MHFDGRTCANFPSRISRGPFGIIDIDDGKRGGGGGPPPLQPVSGGSLGRHYLAMTDDLNFR